MIELRTLGAIDLRSADGSAVDAVLTQPRRMALLCYLALASPRGFRRRDTLLTLLWPEHGQEQARHALRQSLYFLRRALGASAIVSRGDDDVAIAANVVHCDAAEFDIAVEDGRLEQALALYRGEVLPGFHVSDALEFERWLEAERDRLRRRAAEAAWLLADARAADGDASDAAAWGQRAVGHSPGDEVALRRLLHLLDNLGQRATALRVYEAFGQDLARDYELRPSTETRALVARIRATQEDESPVVRQATLDTERDAVATAEVAGATHGVQPRRSRWGRAIAMAALLAVLGVVAPRFDSSGGRARTKGERVIVADFANFTRDSTLGDLVAQVLRAELARSSVLGVVGREAIADALRRMRRDPDTRLTARVARDVAAREQVRVVIEGDVRSAGSGLIFSAAVIETASGDLIHGATETARDSTQIPIAIARLSRGIRGGVGASIGSVRTVDPLLHFTTASLAALRKHVEASRALWRGDFGTAAELLEEATSLDPEFAHAHLLLSQVRDLARLPRAVVLRPLMRAYELRDKLTERDRFAVEGQYHMNVTGNLPAAVVAFRKHIDAVKQYPRGEAGWWASLGRALELSGRLSEAEEVLREGRERHPTALSLARFTRLLYRLHKDSAAGAVREELSRRNPEHPAAVTLRVALLADSGRYDAAHALAASVRRGNGARTDLELQAQIDAIRGRFSEAIDHLRVLGDHALARDDLGLALEVSATIGRLRLLNGERAVTLEVERMLARYPFDSLDVLSRPYLQLALFYADAGEPRQARRWLDSYEREYPSAYRGADRWMLRRARAATYASEGRLAEAFAELREAARVPALRGELFHAEDVQVTDRPELARMYERFGVPDSAIAVYERYLAVRSLNRARMDAFERGTVLGRLATLHERRGNSGRAAVLQRELATLRRGRE